MKALLHSAAVMLVAAAHVLVVTHSTFVVHELSASGALHHQAAAENSATAHTKHESSKATWCAKHFELKPVDDLDCTAAQFASMASKADATSLPSIAKQAPSPSPGREAAQHRALAALITAPKASPPHCS